MRQKKNVKKSNVAYTYSIPTNNKYDSLSEEEDDITDSESELVNLRLKHIKIPPIIVYSYFDNHVKTLKNLQRDLNEDIDLKFKGKRLIVLTKNVADYNAVRKELDERKIQYSTKTPVTEREPKLVIQNLPPNITKEEIIDDLKEKNLSLM